MRRWVLLWWVLVCSIFAAPVSAQVSARTILIVGDSLSAAFGIEVSRGWASLLQQRLAQQQLNYNVVNASVSGDTTANGLARLSGLLTRHRPSVVVIQLGGNDGLRGLQPEQMKHNIAAMVAKAKAHGTKVLIVGVPLPPNYGKPYIERFLQVYRDVAAEQAVTLVPSILEGIGGERGLMQQDGIHPTAGAQSKMLDNVWPQLRTLL